MFVKPVITTMVVAGALVLSACASTPPTPPAAPAASPGAPMAQDHPPGQAMNGPMAEKMKTMPPECQAMMAKMHEKMKSGDMDKAAMKAKMQSGEGMSAEQKKCHAMMHEKMQAKPHHDDHQGSSSPDHH